MDAVGGGCRLAVVQPLPAAVYVDVDQLAALQAAGAPFEANLFGESLIRTVSSPALTRCPLRCAADAGRISDSWSLSLI